MGGAGPGDATSAAQALDAELQQLAAMLEQSEQQRQQLQQHYDELAAHLQAAMDAEGGAGQ